MQFYWVTPHFFRLKKKIPDFCATILQILSDLATGGIKFSGFRPDPGRRTPLRFPCTHTCPPSHAGTHVVDFNTGQAQIVEKEKKHYQGLPEDLTPIAGKVGASAAEK